MRSVISTTLELRRKCSTASLLPDGDQAKRCKRVGSWLDKEVRRRAVDRVVLQRSAVLGGDDLNNCFSIPRDGIPLLEGTHLQEKAMLDLVGTEVQNLNVVVSIGGQEYGCELGVKRE